MAGGNEQLGPGVLYLLCFDSAVKDSLLDIGSSPRAAAGAAAEVVGPVGIHLYKIFTALLCNPPGLLVVSVAESPLALAAVIAWIMIGGQMAVDRLVELDSPFV